MSSNITRNKKKPKSINGIKTEQQSDKKGEGRPEKGGSQTARLIRHRKHKKRIEEKEIAIAKG